MGMVIAEAGDKIKKGQLVKLVAVPLDKDETPGGVADKSVEQGEYVDIIDQGKFYISMES